MNETTPRSKSTAYENNPFFVAINGLELLFEKARPIGIALLVLAFFSAIGPLRSFVLPSERQNDQSATVTNEQGKAIADTISNIPAEMWLLIGAIALAVVAVMLAIGIIFRGVLDYTSARIATGETVTLSEAFRAVFGSFWSYTWVLTIMTVKVLLWSLLLVVPGIIMAVRYSLAGVSFYASGLKGDAAVQHSSGLVKGAWLTTFASQTLLPILTLGYAQNLLAPGINAVLYRQLEQAGTTKPKAHLLSWLVVIIPFVIILAIIAAMVLMLAAFMNYQRTT